MARRTSRYWQRLAVPVVIGIVAVFAIRLFASVSCIGTGSRGRSTTVAKTIQANAAVAGEFYSMLDAWADEIPGGSSTFAMPRSLQHFVASRKAADAVLAYVDAERTMRRRARGARRLHAAHGLDVATPPSHVVGDAASIEKAAAAGPHEDDVWLPEPTKLEGCVTQVDGSELCVYSNACVDALPAGETVDSTNFKILFIDSDVVLPPSTAPLTATDGVADTASATRHARHAARLAYDAGDLRQRLSGQALWRAEMLQYDSVFEDIPPDAAPSFTARLRKVPFSFGTESVWIPPSETVPDSMGGTHNGTVSWVDGLYVARLGLGGQLWGCGAALPFALFGAWYANTTQGLNLPPVDVLAVLHKDHVRLDDPSSPDALGGGSGAWCLDGLAQVARHADGGADGAPGWVGRTADPPSREGTYPYLDELAAATERQTKEKTNAGEFADAALDTTTPAQASPPFRVPYSMLELRNTQRGARIVFSTGDLPDAYPAPFARELRPSSVQIMDESPTSVKRTTPRRHRVCGKRVVALGNRALLLGGAGEGTAWREFAISTLGLPRDAPFRYDYSGAIPPPRLLFFTRAGSRSFYNLHELQAVADKYHVPYTVVAEEQLKGLSFAQQAALVRDYGIAVAIHGAGETQFGFLRQRSVIIEINPYQMWCPIYHKYLTAIGHTVLPIYTRLKSPDFNWEFMQAKTDEASTDALWQRCEAEHMIHAARTVCWAESKSMRRVYVPVHEFEHTLIRGLDLIGEKVFPQNSAIDMLHGIAQGGPDTKFAPEGFYRNASWVLCPPSTVCPAPVAGAINEPNRRAVHGMGNLAQITV